MWGVKTAEFQLSGKWGPFYSLLPEPSVPIPTGWPVQGSLVDFKDLNMFSLFQNEFVFFFFKAGIPRTPVPGAEE